MYGVLTWKITDQSLSYFTDKVYKNNSAIKLFGYCNEESKTREHKRKMQWNE